MAQAQFVPSGFVVPLALATEQFRLEPLGPQHNDSDYEAWSTSVEHIHLTPGWETSSWPDDRTFEENASDAPKDVPPEQWFPAEDGLTTVRALLAYLEAHPNEVPGAQAALMVDLRQFEEVLEELGAAGIRWHLAVDY